MRAHRALAVFVVLATLPLAGCLGGDDAEGDDPTSLANSSVDGGDTLLPNGTGANATSPTDLTGGHLPHLHNYWGEQDRITLFDDEVDLHLFGTPTWWNIFNRKTPAVGGTYWELPEGATVYEGTGILEITATWTEPTITNAAVSYKPANVPWRRDSFSEWLPLASGTPVPITVTPEMTDMPHESVSRWAFMLGAGSAGGLASGTIQLKVDIVRMRDIMAFPGHPDTYEDTDHYVLADKDFTYKSQSFVGDIADFVLDAENRDPVVPDEPVPMETTAILVEFKVTSATTTAPSAAGLRVSLFYRTASGRGDFIEALNSTEDTFVFGVPVDTSDVDSPYATMSQWEFHPFARKPIDIPGSEGGINCGSCFDSEIQGHVVIRSYEIDPTGEIGEVEDDDDN